MQAYEDVLERYKGEAGARPAPAAARGPRLGPPGPAARPAAGGAAGGGRAHPRGAGPGREPRPPLGAGFGRVERNPPRARLAGRRRSPLSDHQAHCLLYYLAGAGGRETWSWLWRAAAVGLRGGGGGVGLEGERLSIGFPGRAFPAVALGGRVGGRPPAFVSLPLGGVARDGSLGCRAPRGSRGVGGGWVGGWVAWPVSVQISVARPPHPHAAPLDVWACLVEAGV